MTPIISFGSRKLNLSLNPTHSIGLWSILLFPLDFSAYEEWEVQIDVFGKVVYQPSLTTQEHTQTELNILVLLNERKNSMYKINSQGSLIFPHWIITPVKLQCTE